MKKIFNNNKLLLVISVSIAVFFAVVLQNLKRDIIISEISPTDSQLSFTDNFRVTFENLDEDDKDNIVATFNPPVKFALKWEENRLLVFPDVLKFNQEYELYIFYRGQNILVKNYITPKLADLTQDELDKYSALNVASLHDQYVETLEEKPWLTGLPIIDKSYLITYDIEEQYYRVRIWNSDELDEDSIDLVKEDALYDLVQIDASAQEDLIFILD